MQAGAFFDQDEGGDDAEIAEAVAQGNHSKMVLRRLQHGFQLPQRVAFGGDIELVGLGEHLVHALQTPGIYRTDACFHLQLRQVVAHAVVGGRKANSFGFLLILQCLVAVVGQYDGFFETGQRIQRRDESGGI